MDLYEQLARSYVKVFELFGTPRAWRTADAFARMLIAHGTIEGFPAECISADNSPIAGLAEALTKSLSNPCDCWLLDYLKYA
jgi:hypothetical protein